VAVRVVPHPARKHPTASSPTITSFFMNGP
jgi:hypothetical protein